MFVCTFMNTVYNTLSTSKLLGGMVLTLSSYTIADVQIAKHQSTVNLATYQNELKRYGEALEDPEARERMVKKSERDARAILRRTEKTANIVEDINAIATRFRATSDRALAELHKCNGQWPE